jgi:hypothetical protein
METVFVYFKIIRHNWKIYYMKGIYRLSWRCLEQYVEPEVFIFRRRYLVFMSVQKELFFLSRERYTYIPNINYSRDVTRDRWKEMYLKLHIEFPFSVIQCRWGIIFIQEPQEESAGKMHYTSGYYAVNLSKLRLKYIYSQMMRTCIQIYTLFLQEHYRHFPLIN